MASMRKLVVSEKNIIVARVALHYMRQNHDKTVREFGSQLQGRYTFIRYQ